MLKEQIEKFNTIIIHRHKRPDLDAIGSQVGLYYAIKNSYKDKKVYIVGDDNKYCFLHQMDIVDDKIYDGALAIIVDVAVSNLVSDDRYLSAKKVIVIDHHKNESDIDALLITDSTYSSCAELIFTLLQKENLRIDDKAATALFGGIVTDTGRFLYSSITENTFFAAYSLLKLGADHQYIYDNIYKETLEDKKLKAFFQNRVMLTDNNVAYLFNDQSLMEKLDKETFFISRGMVGVMAGLEGINIWVNFTYDNQVNKVLVEIRSIKEIEVLPIAKKYGGGGHAQACGATIDNFDVALKVLNDLNELAGEYNEKNN